MKKSPCSVVVICVWICAALANVTFTVQPVSAWNASAISWNGSVMPAPQ